MTRTTVTLPDDLAAQLRREAKRRELPVSEIVRRAVADFLGVRERGGRRRLTFTGAGASGHRHTARNAEEILRAEWTSARRR